MSEMLPLDSDYIVCEMGDRIAAVEVLCSLAMGLCENKLCSPVSSDDPFAAPGLCNAKAGVMFACQTLGVEWSEFETALGLLGVPVHAPEEEDDDVE